MKLEFARGLFLVASLGVASLAAAAWQEPGPEVIKAEKPVCCSAPTKAQPLEALSPNEDLLLLLFGLYQGMGGER